MSQLVDVKKGGSNSGTWIHPSVAIHLAHWIGPRVSLSMIDLVFRFLQGDLTLIPEIVDCHDDINDTKTITTITEGPSGDVITTAQFHAQLVEIQSQLKEKSSVIVSNHLLEAKKNSLIPASHYFLLFILLLLVILLFCSGTIDPV